MNIICVIGARGGSQGLPNKNIKLLLGKPLIAWSIEAAISSNLFDKVVDQGIIIFDEYESQKYPGCKKAVLEYFNEKDIKKHKIWDRHYSILKK